MKNNSQKKARGALSFPVAAVYSSPERYSALMDLFSSMPDDPGMAFIVIHHQNPDYKSMIEEMAQCTGMGIIEASGSLNIEKDRIYLMRPGEALAIKNGNFVPPGIGEKGDAAPLRRFFPSFAESYKERALAVFLRDLDSDCLEGIRDLKKSGGVVFAEPMDDPESGRALADAALSGALDFILPVETMPHILKRCAEYSPVNAEEGLIAEGAESWGMSIIKQLEEKLKNAKESLANAVSKIKQTTEELRVSRENEEFVKEELRLSKEDLKSSKNRVYTLNAEISSIYKQLRQKIDELEVINNDQLNLLDVTEIAIVFFDRQMGIKRFTPAAERMLGLNEPECSGVVFNISRVLGDYDVKEIGKRVLSTGEAETSFSTSPDGRFFKCRLIPCRTAGDEIKGLVLTVDDITALRKRDQALKTSEKEKSDILNSLQEYVFLLDDNLNLNWANRPFIAEAESERGDIWTERPCDILKCSVRENSDLCPAGRVLAEGTAQRGEVVFDEGRTFIISAAPLLDNTGNLNGVVESALDITGRKVLEKELERERTLLRTVIDSIPVMISIYDPGIKDITLNRAFHRITGWTEKDIEKENVMNLVYPDPEYRAEIAEFMGNPGPDWKDLKMTCADGSTVQTSWCNIRLDDGRRVGIGVDMTDRVKAERTMEHALQQKSILLKEINHRVKNNLQMILSIIDMQMDNLACDPDINIVEGIYTRVLAMAHVHQKLYDTERYSEIALKSYIQDVVDSIISIMKRSGAKEISAKVEGDEIFLSASRAISLGMLINELVTNSIKHAFSEREECAIHVKIKSEGGALRLTVSDNGSGIPDGVSHETVDSLGLTLVNMIVKQLQGEIILTPQGEGTEWVVTIPKGEEE